MIININSANVLINKVTTVSNTSNLETHSLLLAKLKGVSQNPLDLNLSKSYHDTDYGAHDMAYSAYVRKKREKKPTPDMNSNDIGAAIERMQPKETARCFEARALLRAGENLFVNSASINHNYHNVVNSPFCKFVFRNPPPPKAISTTPMCN